jgi:hypothetical protein
MVPFEYVGREREQGNVIRSMFIAALLVMDAILLFPFLLLDLFFWSLRFVAGRFTVRT